ncbi:MAG: glycosyltransferase family 2 protein [Eubacterium sp.]|nr:glycosyltransferase family 2 protein [Eubacterium sp.]
MKKTFALTVAIPCYNSAAYMRKAVEGAAMAGQDVEVIIVDDGSSDDTLKVAEELAAKHPDRIQVVHKENGGHGSAVNAGLAHARGIFFKVLDSDDWFDVTEYTKMLRYIGKMLQSGKLADMIVVNYVYDKPSEKKQKAIRYRNIMKSGRMIGWKDMGKFRKSQNLLMHSLVYRTEVLRKCKLELPEHTFYVDNLFAYNPLPEVKKIMYIDANVYHYFIGREDQSVNEKVMIGRIDQQIRVTKLMIDQYDLSKIKNKNLRDYMYHYLAMIMTVSSVLLIKSGTPENLQKRDELWAYLKKTRPEMYEVLDKDIVAKFMQSKSSLGRGITKIGYKISQKIYAFN